MVLMFRSNTNTDPTKPDQRRLTRTAMALMATAAIAGCTSQVDGSATGPERPAATSSAEAADTAMIEQLNQRAEATAVSMAQEIASIAESPANEASGEWTAAGDDGSMLMIAEHSTPQPDGTVAHVALQIQVEPRADGTMPVATEFNADNIVGVDLSAYSTDAQGNNSSTIVPYTFNLSQSGVYEGSWVANVYDARENPQSPEQYSQIFTTESGANDPALVFESAHQLDLEISQAEELVRAAG